MFSYLKLQNAGYAYIFSHSLKGRVLQSWIVYYHPILYWHCHGLWDNCLRYVTWKSLYWVSRLTASWQKITIGFLCKKGNGRRVTICNISCDSATRECFFQWRLQTTRSKFGFIEKVHNKFTNFYLYKITCWFHDTSDWLKTLKKILSIFK